ncbi:hypothetical protein NE865_02419 [Phthorimaea operculella]|nr:hypothetical protein NE865_02419 [Phthorimaea operculella]
MVFYYTSANIKILRNIWMDFEEAKETTAYEYIQTYIEKCPSSIDDQKLTWVAETFLGHHKHFGFLRDIATHLSKELSEEDQDYLIIALYAITFQLQPKDMELLYKSMFNLSKPLLNTFTDFLSNNEQLQFISQVAQVYYDAQYVTDNIIAPLFVWQPYISEMAHNYAEYVQKVENRRIKPPTVPIQTNLSIRKGKTLAKETSHDALPATPPNSVHNKNRKMLTKSVIDKRLKAMHEKNKQDATNLLSVVKNDKDFHYARPKGDGYYNKPSYEETNMPTFTKPKKVVSKSSIPVRENIATMRRIKNRVQMTEQEEIEWIQNLMCCCRNPTQIEELMEHERLEKEKDRLYDIEKKHLLGQISHEEAVLAKKKVEDENKIKYNEFLKQKQKWESEINEWKTSEIMKNRANIERIALGELLKLKAVNAVVERNKDTADNIRRENEQLLANAMKEKQEELDQKIKMIKQIKILGVIAKKSRVAKIVDLTETSGVGLLCEMSIAELQERLAGLKIQIQDELQKRKEIIKESNDAAKKDLEETRNAIKAFITERAEMKEQAKAVQKAAVTLEGKNSKEINDLKKTLEEKRKIRASLQASKYPIKVIDYTK